MSKVSRMWKSMEWWKRLLVILPPLMIACVWILYALGIGVTSTVTPIYDNYGNPYGALYETTTLIPYLATVFLGLGWIVGVLCEVWPAKDEEKDTDE